MDVRVALLGTGCSSETPINSCILGLIDEFPVGGCPVCREAYEHPDTSLNRRDSPTLLLQVKREGEPTRNVLFDVGKTFRSTVLRFFPKFNVPWLDAVVLTHDHADAMYGLDDIRMLQHTEEIPDETGTAVTTIVKEPMAVYCSDKTYSSAKFSFPYICNTDPLFPTKLHAPTGLEPHEPPSTQSMPDKAVSEKEGAQSKAKAPVKIARFVSKLDWNIIARCSFKQSALDEEFELYGVRVQPIPLWHGGSYVSIGYVLHFNSLVLAYLSDVKAIPEITMKYLTSLPKLDILVIDCLSFEGEYSSHMVFPETLAAIKQLKPVKTYFTGQGHRMMYTEGMARLAELKESDGLDIEMGYDGLVVVGSD
eukprot:m.86449 g.86449  ORF g.86449 m.86449 type:complete len:365 (+) comp12810_c0_seq2:60-1154(+)